MSEIRESDEYKSLDSFTAVGYAEGFVDCPSEHACICAWQWLEDTGTGRSLQGWFARALDQLIEAGVIEPRAQVLAGAGYQDGGEPYTPEELALINQ